MLNKIKVGPKLIAGFLLVAAIGAGMGIYGTIEMKTMDALDTALYKENTVPITYMSNVSTFFQRARVNLADLIRANEPSEIQAVAEKISELSADITKNIDLYEALLSSDEEKRAFRDFETGRDAFRANLDKIIALARENKDAEAWAVVEGDARKAALAEQEAIDRLIEINVTQAQKRSESNTAMADHATLTMILLSVFGTIIALVIGIFLTLSITRPLQKGVTMMQELSRGHLGMRLRVDRQDEIGMMAAAMDGFADDLQNIVIGTMQKIADGDVSTEIALKDSQDEIAPALKKVTDSLRGLIAEMNNMARQHDLGDIDVVIATDKFQGAYREMAKGVNQMVADHIALNKKAMACVAEFGRGNFDAPLEKFPGKKAFINEMIEAVRKNLKDISAELIGLIDSSKSGELSKRGNAAAYQGDWQKMVGGVNEILDAILQPINEAATVLEKVAGRDMTARVKGDYKGDHARIKVALNTAVDNLDKALTQVAEAVEQVSSASQQISAGSQSLAQGANEQASSLEEVSSSLEEMASMTKQNAQNANQAKALAAEANGNAGVGSQAMARMSESIQKIKESSDQTAKIVKTIDEIAMQTNLLALNAAVEAARAGEAGRGFAVVAEEVRNLAQRSAQAAKNTADMISESVKNADDGVKISTEVAKSFAAIAGSARKVDDLIAEIAAASGEQSQGIDQVNNAVAQMDKVTQQNAANSEESASAAEELSSQAEELAGMVGQFTISQALQKKGSAVVVSHQALAAPAKSQPLHFDSRKSKPAVRNNHRRKAETVAAEEVIPLDEEVLREF